jgi:hypothetical protein
VSAQVSRVLERGGAGPDLVRRAPGDGQQLLRDGDLDGGVHRGG